jgi:hypothetical protein
VPAAEPDRTAPNRITDEEPPTMARHLILANQTLGGAELERAVRERVEQGGASFYVVVPEIAPYKEATSWEGDPRLRGSFTPPGFEPPEQARERARHRLDRLVELITAAGGEADGEVGQNDPVAALENVLERQAFDEIIISTLPVGLSRWLKMDLPARIARVTDLPVTTYEAKR